MNVTLRLNPEVERALMARAQERGVPLDAYLQEIVAREAGAPMRHIADVIRERMSKAPPEIMATMPTDGASQHDHYIYDSPKKSSQDL